MIGYYNIHAFLCVAICSILIYIYRVYDVKANRNRKKKTLTKLMMSVELGN